MMPLMVKSDNDGTTIDTLSCDNFVRQYVNAHLIQCYDKLCFNIESVSQSVNQPINQCTNDTVQFESMFYTHLYAQHDQVPHRCDLGL